MVRSASVGWWCSDPSVPVQYRQELRQRRTHFRASGWVVDRIAGPGRQPVGGLLRGGGHLDEDLHRRGVGGDRGAKGVEAILVWQLSTAFSRADMQGVRQGLRRVCQRGLGGHGRRSGRSSQPRPTF